MATQEVVNPTNAPHIPGKTALPFTTPRHMQIIAKARNAPDAFNTGGDYKDEGLPLMESDPNLTMKYRGPRAAFAQAPGIIDPPTLEELKALSHMDESAQGTHIHYMESAIVVDVDAKLLLSSPEEMRRGKFKEAHYPTLKDYRNSPYYRRLRESQAVLHNVAKLADKNYFGEGKKGIILNPLQAAGFKRIDNQIVKRLKESFGKKANGNGRRLREGLGGDEFSLDLGSQGASIASNFDMPGNGRDTDFIPLLSGPYNKQLYWFDYLDMHSKAFEAYNHNPIAKRIVKLICQFVLGKGVKATVINAEKATGKTEKDPETGQMYEYVIDLREEAQEILDDHWARNRMAIRSKEILHDFIIFGEQFIRYFDVPDGLKVRSLDPSTIWEVVTDPDDCESEFYIHQQYPTRYQWYVDLPVPTIKYIIRQVPSKLYYHMKLNATSGEVRGRSELFAVLGWLKRLKEFATDRVIRNKMANLFVLDVAVEGGDAEVQLAKTQFGVVPTPGSMFIHNKAAELQGVKAEIGAGDVTPDWDMLMTVIAMGAGVSKQYLGMSDNAGGKAGALVGTEPDVKTFEDYQELMEQFLLYDAKKVFERAEELGKIVPGVVIKVEITYPALAEENRSEKLKDIAFMESMSWISHRRGATMGAKEMQITTYEYDEEQHAIAKEDAEADILFNSAMAQVQKGQAAPPKGGSGEPRFGGAPGDGGSGGASPEENGAAASGPSPAANESVYGTHTESGAKKKGWRDTDPRNFAESLFREARNISLKKKPINRLRNRVLTPDKRRDQAQLDRGKVVTRARRGLHGNYNESLEGGPGSGPHKAETSKDHREAVKYHDVQAAKAKKNKNAESFAAHQTAADKHVTAAKSLEKNLKSAGRDSEDANYYSTLAMGKIKEARGFLQEGGKGSGDVGHAGRKGEVGGSGPGGGAKSINTRQEVQAHVDRYASKYGLKSLTLGNLDEWDVPGSSHDKPSKKKGKASPPSEKTPLQRMYEDAGLTRKHADKLDNMIGDWVDESNNAFAKLSQDVIKGHLKDPMAKALALEAAIAQKTLGKNKELTLYRGVSGKYASAIFKDAVQGKKSIVARSRGADSWTDSPGQAEAFGNLVVQAKVPTKYIMTSYRSNEVMDDGDENEFVVAFPNGKIPIEPKKLDLAGERDDGW